MRSTSAPERQPPPPRRLLAGWGRTSPSCSTLSRPASAEEIADALASAAADGGAIARGAGRSYGDAAQNGDGRVLETSLLDGFEIFEDESAPIAGGAGGGPAGRAASGIGGAPAVHAGSGAAARGVPTVRARSGVALSRLVLALGARRLALPVVPGTRHITVGGAIAADVHGKNHRSDGSFGHHVLELHLVTPDGQLRTVSRHSEADLFFATLGGMGLTGVIVDALLRVERLRSGALELDVERCRDLDEVLAAMQHDDGHRYSIAWVDLLAAGRDFGRSVLTRSTEREHSLTAADRPVRLPGRPRLRVPSRLDACVLTPGFVRAFNSLRWHRAPRQARGLDAALGQHFFPLDALGDWNLLYGPAGFVQYQLAVPERAAGLIVDATTRMRAAKLPMYLAVVKRFGEGSGGMLSFPAPGWTISIDMPASSPRLYDTLDEIDERVAAAGGRVYLAKDSRLRGDLLAQMYPQLPRFLRVRAEIDPDGALRSDLGARLGLLRDGVE